MAYLKAFHRDRVSRFPSARCARLSADARFQSNSVMSEHQTKSLSSRFLPGFECLTIKVAKVKRSTHRLTGCTRIALIQPPTDPREQLTYFTHLPPSILGCLASRYSLSKSSSVSVSVSFHIRNPSFNPYCPRPHAPALKRLSVTNLPPAASDPQQPPPPFPAPSTNPPDVLPRIPR